MTQTTLRVTLYKLTLHSAPKKYTKVTVALRSKDSFVSLPNPRFLQDKVANFYSHNLSMLIESPKQSVQLEVYGISGCSKDIIGKSIIEPSKIGEVLELGQELGNKTFDLDYKASLVEVEQVETLPDEDLVETEFFLSNFDLPNFAQRLQKRSELVPSQQDTLKTSRPLSHSSHLQSYSIETQSDQQKDKSFKSSLRSNKRKCLKRKDSFDSSKQTDIPDYKFIEPITHCRLQSSTKSVAMANNQQEQKSEKDNQLGKSRCQICHIRIPVRNILQYAGISFACFIMGTVAKQGLWF